MKQDKEHSQKSVKRMALMKGQNMTCMSNMERQGRERVIGRVQRKIPSAAQTCGDRNGKKGLIYIVRELKSADAQKTLGKNQPTRNFKLL